MNNTTELLLKATRYALKQQTIDLKIEDEASFFKLMVSSGLSGLIIPYLDTKAYSPKFIQKTNAVLYQFIDKDSKQQDLIAKIKSIFQKEQTDHIFLKGTKLKLLYPHTYTRGMGDIDLLVRCDLDRIQHLFSTLDIKLESRSLAHDHYHTKDGLIIEIHPSIHKDFNPKYQTYFKSAWEHTTRVTGVEYTLNPTFELVYLLYHLAKHVESSGIGLRSILDIGIYLEKYKSSIDLNELKETLENLHMMRFYNTMNFLNLHYFKLNGLSIEDTFTMSESLMDEVTEYFITSGIHGKGEHFNAMAPRVAASENKGKSRFRILLRIAFPKMLDARGMYPVLHKHPYLYPFLMGHRMIKLMFFKRKFSLKKIKDLNESNAKRSELEKLFDDIGIY